MGRRHWAHSQLSVSKPSHLYVNFHSLYSIFPLQTNNSKHKQQQVALAAASNWKERGRERRRMKEVDFVFFHIFVGKFCTTYFIARSLGGLFFSVWDFYALPWVDGDGSTWNAFRKTINSRQMTNGPQWKGEGFLQRLLFPSSDSAVSLWNEFAVAASVAHLFRFALADVLLVILPFSF